MPTSKFLATQETRNMNRSYPKDFTEYSSFDNTLFKSIAQGSDSIDHTDYYQEMITESLSRFKILGSVSHKALIATHATLANQKA